MSYNAFYKQLDESARLTFPRLSAEAEVSWEYLISPLEIELPKSVLSSVEKAVRAFFKTSRRPKYASTIQGVPPEILDAPVKNHSVLMAYDFHTTEDGQAFLVEINTNAAGYLLAGLMEAAHQATSLLEIPPAERLKESFFNELKLFGKSEANIRAAITDEDIFTQRMYPEFIMFRELFKSWGWSAEIVESSEVKPSDFDLIYNRLTDFYLESPQHEALRTAFLKAQTCLSPQPREYALLADKQRLVELATEGFLERIEAPLEDITDIRRVLIPTFEPSHFGSEDEIWARKKNLFFKPKRSFGGKSVYRGESVSRKVFERLLSEGTLIQKFVPAQRVPTDDPRSVLTNWKFDLRCFAYEDQIQFVTARIYQGQVTNFASPLGGFTRVKFV